MQPVPKTQRYRISCQANGDHPLIQYSTTTTSRQTGLVLGVNYSITVSASMDFTRYRGGNCYYGYLYGEYSNPVYVVTQESCMLNHVLYKYINKSCVYTMVQLNCRKSCQVIACMRTHCSHAFPSNQFTSVSISIVLPFSLWPRALRDFCRCIHKVLSERRSRYTEATM